MGKASIDGPQQGQKQAFPAKTQPPPALVRVGGGSVDLGTFRRTGKEILTGSTRILMKLEGFPGSGKTMFYMGEASRAKALGIAPEDTLIFVIDFIGGSGITDIVQRSAFFPVEYVDSIVHIQCPTLSVGDAAMEEFLKMCVSKQYRHVVLAIEGDHMIFEKARDEYVLSTRGKYYDQLVNDSLNRQVEINANAKNVFDESIRDAYAYINPRYSRFVDTAFMLCERVKCNLYMTAHLEYKTVRFDEPQQLRVLGKPQRIDGYFDHILRLFVKEDFLGERGKVEKVSRYLIDMKKCRKSKVMVMPNNGLIFYILRVEAMKKSETMDNIYAQNVVRDGDRLDESRDQKEVPR